MSPRYQSDGFWNAQKFVKNRHAFPFPSGGNLTQSPMSSSWYPLPRLWACMEFAHAQVMSTRIVRSGQPDAEVFYGPAGYDDVILRMEAQELRCRHRIYEETARSELESIKREARRSLLYQTYQRQLIWLRSESQDAWHNQRDYMQLKQQTLFQIKETEKRVLQGKFNRKLQDSEKLCTSRWCNKNGVLRIRERLRHSYQCSYNPKNKKGEATLKCEKKDRKTRSGNHVIFRNDVSDVTSAFDSSQSEASWLAKEKLIGRGKFCFCAGNARVMRGREWDHNWWTDAGRSKWTQKSMARCWNEFIFSKTAGFLPKRQQIGKFRDKKRRITRKEYQRLLNMFDMEGFMAQKGLWNLARNKALQGRGALPQEKVTPLESLRLCTKAVSWAHSAQDIKTDCHLVATLENALLGLGFWSRSGFPVPLETELWSNFWLSGLFEAPESIGEVCFALRRFLHRPRFCYRQTFFGLAFMSSLGHDTLLSVRKKRPQENIEKFMMFNNRRRWSTHHV